MRRTRAMSTLAPIAEGQHGLLTTRQAALSGVSRLDLSRLEDEGDLHRVTYGVYRMQGVEPDDATELRAHWLALDPGRTADERARDRSRMVAVSHRSAARLHGIGDLHADRHHYTATYRKQTSRPEVLVGQSVLEASDVVVERGMLVTTVERTLGDLARTEPDLSHVSDALADAVENRLTTPSRVEPHLEGALHRHRARSTGDLVETMLQYSGLDMASLMASVMRDPAIQSVIAHVAEVAAIDAIVRNGQDLADTLTSVMAAQVVLRDVEATKKVIADCVSQIALVVDIVKSLELPDLTAALPGVEWGALAQAALLASAHETPQSKAAPHG